MRLTPSRFTNAWQNFFQIMLGDLQRVYRLLPHRLRLRIWLLFGGMLLSAAMEVLSISTLALLGMSLASPQATAHRGVFIALKKSIPGLDALYADPLNFVLFTAILVFVVFVIKNIIQAILMWQTAIIGERISIYLGEKVLHLYLCSPYTWHLSSNSSRMFTALSSRERVGMLVIQILSMHVYSIAALALLVTLLSATPGAIFGATALISISAFALYSIVKSKVDRCGKKALVSAQEQNTSLMAAMNGIREVLIYRQQDVFLEHYIRACREGIRARSFLSIAPPLPAWVLECLGIGIIPLSVWIMVAKGSTDTASLTAVISLVMLAAWRILPMVNRALAALLTVRGIRPVFLETLTVLEEMQTHTCVTLPEPDPNFRFDREITLENVSFRYPGAKRDALCDVSMTVKKGEQIGFIGLSGAGKSTIIALFSGLMQPETGRILVDGEPLNPERAAAYMGQVGLVPQSPYILAGSVADNVAFSQWGRPYDRGQVIKACREAALEMVDQGLGIDTPLGERGAGLSGGQAQRVSIARALFCSPEVLILDESTSSLDQANEDAIMDTIDKYRGKLTTFIVAHRLTTLKNCDRLFWLDKGKLIASGPTEEMLALYTEHMRESHAQRQQRDQTYKQEKQHAQEKLAQEKLAQD